MMNSALRIIRRIDNNLIGCYLVTWGSPVNTDLDGEYFTSETLLGQVKGLPVFLSSSWSSHDDLVQIGRIVNSEIDSDGLYVNALIEDADGKPLTNFVDAITDNDMVLCAVCKIDHPDSLVVDSHGKIIRYMLCETRVGFVAI